MYSNKDFGRDGDKVHADKCTDAHGGKYCGKKCEAKNMESEMEVAHIVMYSGGSHSCQLKLTTVSSKGLRDVAFGPTEG